MPRSLTYKFAKLYFLFQGTFCHGLSLYKEAVVVYIAGYVVKMVRKKLKCPICLDALTCSREEAESKVSFALLNRKRWGNLIDSSSDVITVCIETEKIFTVLLKENSEIISKKNLLVLSIVDAILKKFFLKAN